MRKVLIRMSCVIGAAAATLLLQQCCNRETKRIQPHWLRAGEDFGLLQVELDRAETSRPTERLDIRAIPQSSERCFSDLGIEACIADQEYGFWMDLTNKRGEPILLLWPEARYIDELGVSHELFAQERGALPDDRGNLKPSPPQAVNAGQLVRPTIVPIYKQYLVASGCRDLYPYSEPLVPSRLDDKNEQQMKAYVDDLAKRQVPVKLLLPIEVGGKRYDYLFTFVLRNRWAGLPP